MVFVSRRLILPAALAFGCAFFGALRTARGQDSPFVQAGGAAGGKAPAESPYELAGASVGGGTVQVCLYDVRTKSSRWITVGTAADQVQVVSYDAKAERAVIRIDGIQQVLGLRSASVVASPPQSVWQTQTLTPMPSATAIPAVPGESQPQAPKSAKVLREEEEARMLVSDLLEIGVKQRKAYEEAQKRASAPKP